MSSSRLKLRDPRELLAPSPPQPPAAESPARAPAMADATAAVASAAPAKKALRTPSPQTQTHSRAPPEGEPIPKKRRLLANSEAADASESPVLAPPSPPSSNTKAPSDAQDILARACFAVGLDSDLAESVVEDPHHQEVVPPPPPIPPPPPQPHEAIHYVQDLRGPYPAEVRMRRPHPPPPEGVRIHPGMHHHVGGGAPPPSYALADPQHPFHQLHPRFHDPRYAVPRRVPVHADPRHYRPPHPGHPPHAGPPSAHPRYQYVACPRPGVPPRAILVPERVPPPPQHPTMHREIHDSRHPPPPPPALHHDPRHPQSHPPFQHDPRLPPPPEYRHPGARMAPDGRHHLAPGQAEVRYRVPINHREVAIVAPASSPSVVLPPQGKMERMDRPSNGDQRSHSYEVYASPPGGSSHIPKEAPFGPVSPHGHSGHYGPPHVAEQYNKHPFIRPEMSREPGPWQGQATPPPGAPVHHTLEHRPPMAVRSPQMSPQENAWAVRRLAEGQEKAGEFMAPRRLREPKPCVELIPLRVSTTQETERKSAEADPSVLSSPGHQPQPTQGPVSPATVTPVNHKAYEREAPSEKYARLNNSNGDECQKDYRGPPSSTHLRSQSLPTPETVVHRSVLGRRAISTDDSTNGPTKQTHIQSNSGREQENQAEEPQRKTLAKDVLQTEERLEIVTTKEDSREARAQTSQEKDRRTHDSANNPEALGPGQLHVLHTSNVLGQNRSASEPPPGAAGLPVNPVSALRPASLPAATQICVTNRIAESNSGKKPNGDTKPPAENTAEGDQVFVERLRLVLDDLVSVPEASLPKESHSPQHLLAYLIRQGGGQPSSHPCLRQRLRQDFLTMVKRCMPRNTLSDWGWDSCAPEQILDQLIKVSNIGEEIINGGEQSITTSVPINQDEPLEDDVFASTSHESPDQKKSHTRHSQSVPSPTTPAVPSTTVSSTSVTNDTSAPGPTPPKGSPENIVSREDSSSSSLLGASTSKTPSPHVPTPKTSPVEAPKPITSSSQGSTSRASEHNRSSTQSPIQKMSQECSPRRDMTALHTAIPHTSTNHTVVPSTFVTHTTTVRVSSTQTSVSHTSNHTDSFRGTPVTAEAENTSTVDTTVPRSPTIHTTVLHTPVSQPTIAHVNSNEARVMNASVSYSSGPHSSSAYTSPPAYFSQATAAQTLTKHTSALSPTSKPAAPHSVVPTPVHHSHPPQNYAPTSGMSAAGHEPRPRHPVPPTSVLQSAAQVPSSPPGLNDPHYASRQHMMHPSVPLKPTRPPPYHPAASHHPSFRHPAAHPHPAYQTYNHHAHPHPQVVNPSHPPSHPPGHPPVLLPGGQTPHYPRQAPQLAYHQAQHHHPAHYQYAQPQYAQHQAHPTKKWTGIDAENVMSSVVYAALSNHAYTTG